MRSKFEKDIATLLKDKRVKFKYEPHGVPYIIEASYFPDFKIGEIYIEAKGHFTAQDRKKMKAVKESNPNMDIRFWFMRDNYLTKAKKSRYSDWAKKHGFPYHVGLEFPKKWFNKKENKK